MENLNTQLIKATEDYLKSDKLKEVISKQAEDMINDVVKEAFRWSGNIRKQIEDVVKNELSINTKELGISGHNKFLTEVIGNKLKQHLRHDVESEINKTLEKMLSPIDKVVSIETLKEELFKSADKSSLGCGCDDRDYILENFDEDDIFTFIVEGPSESRYEWVTIYIDTKPNKSEYECQFSLTVHKNFTTFKERERDLKAKDKILNPYMEDIEDFIYAMFLNDSTIDYADAKSLA